MRERSRRGRWLYRLVIYLAVFLLAFQTMMTPGMAAELLSGKTGTSVYVNLGAGKDGRVYMNPHHPEAYQAKYTVKSGGKSYVGYCMQPSKNFNNGYSYKSKKASSATAWKNLSASKQRLLALVMFYGYNSGKSAPYGNTNDYYAATQALVWETVDGDIGISEHGDWTHKSNSHYNLVYGRTYAKKCYDKIKRDIAAHIKGASFTRLKKEDAATYDMTYDYSTKKWSVTLKDKNEAAKLKKLAATSKGLSVKRSGYEYTFTAEKSGTYTAVLGNTKSSGTGQPLLIFQASSNANQSIILGAEDQTKFYVKFRTEKTGNARIVKTSDDGKVKGFTFRVTNSSNHYDKTLTTDETGLIAKNLYPGKYKVTEVLTEAQKEKGYVAPAAKTITVLAGKTSQITMHNKRVQAKMKLQKTSDNGEVEGFSFHVKSSDGSFDKTFRTDGNGLITADLYPGTYTITEKLTREQVQEGYIPETASRKLTVTAKDQRKTLSVSFHNIVKKHAGLQIVKSVTDGGSVEGFTFHISGIIDDTSVTVTEKELLEKVDISSDDAKITDVKLDEKALEKLNEDARDGKTGTYGLTVTVSYEKDGKEEEKRIDAEVTSVSSDGKEHMEAAEEEGFHWNHVTLPCAAALYEEEAVTDAYGKIERKELKPGRYTVAEILTDAQKVRYEAPEPQSLTLKDGSMEKAEFVFVTNEAKETDVKLRKTCVDGNISGIEFTVSGTYAWGEAFGEKKVKTDENGFIEMNLQPGTYTFSETGLDAGKYVPAEPVTVTVTGEEKEPVEVTFENIPYEPVEITKEDVTTGKELPGASMQLLDGETEDVIYEWTSSEEAYRISDLIHGKEYIIHEDAAPAGYKLAQDIHFIAGDEKKVTVSDEPTALLLAKIDEDTRRVLPGAEFTITDGESGEVITAFTVIEQDGKAYGRFQDGSLTRERDVEAAVEGPLDEDVLTDEKNQEELPDAYYLLLDGLVEGKEYVLTEIAAPEGYTPADPYTFIFEDDMRIEVENGRPSIETTALDSETDDHISCPDSEITITDFIDYSNLTIGKEYVVKGILMDKSTGEELKDDMGNTITAEKTFIPEAHDGRTAVEFTFKGVSLKNRTAVVFESLYDGELEVAVHADISDESQSVVFPEIGTTAKDSENGSSFSPMDGEITITDTVDYHNLIPGKEYNVRGTLYDKVSHALTEVTGETVFVPVKQSGTVDVTFDLRSLKITEGASFTVFETVYYSNVEIASHEDPEDEGQSIYIPAIHTNAVDGKDGDKMLSPKDEVMVKDRVSYEHLKRGETYEVKGILMDQKSGKPLKIDGKNVEGAAVFTAGKEKGTADVTFTFSAEGLSGKSLVCYEALYWNDVPIAYHEDINDQGQTVKVGTITQMRVKTGIDLTIYMLFIVSLASAIAMIARRRRSL